MASIQGPKYRLFKTLRSNNDELSTEINNLINCCCIGSQLDMASVTFMQKKLQNNQNKQKSKFLRKLNANNVEIKAMNFMLEKLYFALSLVLI